MVCVRWYLRYKLSFRDLVEMMAERGLSLAHTTIMRWIRRFAPEFEKRWNRFARLGGSVLARRRDLRQNQRTLDLSLPCRRQRGKDRRFPAARQTGRRRGQGLLPAGVPTGRSAARTRRPASFCRLRRDRRGEHPERHLTNWSGLLQADAFSGYARLYPPDRKPGPIVEALCWSHARRKFFELADIAANARRGKNAAPISPIALEAVKRIDAIFEIEREINGVTAEARLAARRSRSAALVAALEEWTRSERAKLSRHNAVAKAIDYMLTRWPPFVRFLEDGRICLTNNAANERCAAWPWAENHGSSPAQSAGLSAPRSCTR